MTKQLCCAAALAVLALTVERAPADWWCHGTSSCTTYIPGDYGDIQVWLFPDEDFILTPIETRSYASAGVIATTASCTGEGLAYFCAGTYYASCIDSWNSYAYYKAEYGDFHGDIEAVSWATTGPPSSSPAHPSIAVFGSLQIESKCCEWGWVDDEYVCLRSATASGTGSGWATAIYLYESTPTGARSDGEWNAEYQIEIPAANGFVYQTILRDVAILGDVSSGPAVKYLLITTDHRLPAPGMTYDSVSERWTFDGVITGGAGVYDLRALRLTYLDGEYDVNGDGRFNELDADALQTLLGATDEDMLEKFDFDGSGDISQFDVDVMLLLVDEGLDSGVFGDLDGDSLMDCNVAAVFPSYLGLGLSDPGYRIELDYDLDGEIDASDQDAADCNANAVGDACDIAAGTSTDLNANGVPDECDDCNANGVPDVLDIAAGTSGDCDGDYNPDECGPDCNANQVADICELLAGSATDCNANGIPDDCDIAENGDCNANGVPDDCDPDCDADGVPDACELDNNCCSTGHGAGCTQPAIEACVCDIDSYCCDVEWDDLCAQVLTQSCTDNCESSDCNANAIPDECEADCNTNGVADECDISGGISADCDLNSIPDECQTPANGVIYVDQDAAGDGTGANWTDAYRELSDALHFADCSSSVSQIWVAEGVYEPVDEGAGRNATFQLIDGVLLYGGFAGTETQLSGRDPAGHPTVLDGHGQCYHVVTGPSVSDSTTAIDGFVITGGRANGGTSVTKLGGGIYNPAHCDYTIANCTFEDNYAIRGGAIANVYGSDPHIHDCTFRENWNFIGASGSGGGGIFNSYYSNPIIEDCLFDNNYSPSGNGGAICNDVSFPQIDRCTFINQTWAGNGAAIYHDVNGYDRQGFQLHLTECTFANNIASSQGGAIAVRGDAYPLIDLCTFRTSRAAKGGAIYNQGGSLHLRSCLLVDNTVEFYSDAFGGAVYHEGVGRLWLTNCTLSGNTASHGGSAVYVATETEAVATLRNSIFWDNAPDEIAPHSDPAIAVSASDVKGGWSGASNIDEDPMFVNQGEDFRLRSSSPCIDRGINRAISYPSVDLAGAPRIVDGNNDKIPVVDMGAYEFQPRTSVSLLQP